MRICERIEFGMNLIDGAKESVNLMGKMLKESLISFNCYEHIHRRKVEAGGIDWKLWLFDYKYINVVIMRIFERIEFGMNLIDGAKGSVNMYGKIIN